MNDRRVSTEAERQQWKDSHPRGVITAGSRASTPDHADFGITGDLDLRVLVRHDDAAATIETIATATAQTVFCDGTAWTVSAIV